MKEKRSSHGQLFLIILIIGLFVVVCVHQKIYYVADGFSIVVRHSSVINRRRRRTLLIESTSSSLSSSTSSYNNNYNYSPTKQRRPSSSSSSSLSILDQAGGAIYKQSVFTSNEFETIVNEVATLTSRLNKEKSSIAQHRLGAKLPSSSKTIQILKEGSLTVLLHKLLLTTTTDKDRTLDNTNTLLWELSTDLPVEVRLYEKFGSNMAWHIDDVLYTPQPQIEVVITLENTSDCVTMWKAKAAFNNKNNNNEDLLLHCQETDRNSVLILKSGGPEHCVTSLKRGRRMILKCAYVAKNSKFCGEEIQYKEQFGHVVSNGGGKKKNKNKKRGKKSKR